MPVHTSLIVGGTAAIIAALLGGGCGGKTDSEEPQSTAPACDAPLFFINSCSGAVCHGEVGSSAAPPNVDLVSPGFAARLIDQKATYSNTRNRETCPLDNPELMVDSQNPDRSLLLLTMEDQQTCGTSMPYGSSLPNTSQIDCVREWIYSIISERGTQP